MNLLDIVDNVSIVTGMRETETRCEQTTDKGTRCTRQSDARWGLCTQHFFSHTKEEREAIKEAKRAERGE